MQVKAYLEITMKIDNDKRPAAAKVYTDYRTPFLKEIKGAAYKRPFNQRGRCASSSRI